MSVCRFFFSPARNIPRGVHMIGYRSPFASPPSRHIFTVSLIASYFVTTTTTEKKTRSSFFVRSTRVAKEKELSLYYTVRKKFFGNSGVVSLGLISSPSFSFTRNLISLCNSRKKRSSLSPPIRYGSAVALVVLAEAAAAVVV